MEQKEILKNVKFIIHEQMRYDLEDIELETKIEEDIGADSLDKVELLMAIEEEFSLEIPDADSEALLTVKDVVDYLEKRLG